MAKIASKSSASKQKQAQPTARQNIQREIQARAYSLWQQRGRPHGDELSDWFTAERELIKLYNNGIS
ncbi:MAG: DUF2934 domain-containing protein [Candidatus Obscuribacterales bacterium]|nr:DUF2934 domain-containing protein [Candidatus Obscuribacterales bacterium]